MKRIAICYDFDKTLSPENMQEQGLLQDLGWEPNAFWNYVGKFADANNVEDNLAYMYCLKIEAEKKNIPFTKQYLKSFGKKLAFFDGVTDWFDNINAVGKTYGVEVEHFIISSGLKEIVEGSVIANKFKRLYASAYCYDNDGVAVWPSLVVNYTNKTQFLFRISKGCLCERDMSVNDAVLDQSYTIPFNNFVYIGDSLTDIPCMSLLKKYGGTTIAVYDKSHVNTKLSQKLIDENRTTQIFPADYSKDSPIYSYLEEFIKACKQ